MNEEQFEQIVELVVEHGFWVFLPIPMRKDVAPSAVVIGTEQAVKEFESMYLGPGEIWEPGKEAK